MLVQEVGKEWDGIEKRLWKLKWIQLHMILKHIFRGRWEAGLCWDLSLSSKMPFRPKSKAVLLLLGVTYHSTLPRSLRRWPGGSLVLLAAAIFDYQKHNKYVSFFGQDPRILAAWRTTTRARSRTPWWTGAASNTCMSNTTAATATTTEGTFPSLLPLPPRTSRLPQIPPPNSIPPFLALLFPQESTPSPLSFRHDRSGSKNFN